MMTTYCEPWTDHDTSVEFLLQNVRMYVCMYVCMYVSLLQPGKHFCLASGTIQNESTEYKTLINKVLRRYIENSGDNPRC